MDSGSPLRRVSPKPFLSWEKDSWERDGSRGSTQQIQSVFPTLFDFTHTLMAFQVKPCCTVHIFYIFVTFKKKSAGLFLILGEHCVSASSASAPWASQRCVKCPLLVKWRYFNKPFMASLVNSWQQSPPPPVLTLRIFNDIKYSSYFWPNQKTFLLQVSFRNFFKRDFCSGTQKTSLLRAIFFKREREKEMKAR